MRNKSFKIVINGDTWTITRSSKLLDGRTDSDVHGETDFTKKSMVFGPSTHHIAMDVVVHELFHAYASYCYLESSSVGKEDLEEIFADLLGDKIFVIAKQAKEIHRKLKKGST